MVLKKKDSLQDRCARFHCLKYFSEVAVILRIFLFVRALAFKALDTFIYIHHIFMCVYISFVHTQTHTYVIYNGEAKKKTHKNEAVKFFIFFFNIHIDTRKKWAMSLYTLYIGRLFSCAIKSIGTYIHIRICPCAAKKKCCSFMFGELPTKKIRVYMNEISRQFFLWFSSFTFIMK